MTLKFENNLTQLRIRIAYLDQNVASDGVGPGLVGLVGEVLNELRAFLGRWRDQNAQTGLAAFAMTIASSKHHDEVLFLLNLIMLLEARRVMHFAGVNDEFIWVLKAAEERASGGQMSLSCEGAKWDSNYQTTLTQGDQVDEVYEQGLRELTVNWPAKINRIVDRLVFFEAEDYKAWNVEIQEQLVKICLESDFPPKERSEALHIIDCL